MMNINIMNAALDIEMIKISNVLILKKSYNIIQNGLNPLIAGDMKKRSIRNIVIQYIS